MLTFQGFLCVFALNILNYYNFLLHNFQLKRSNKFLFLSGVMETWAYFYCPIAILLVINVTLFIFSSSRIWFKRNLSDSTKLPKMKYRSVLEIKFTCLFILNYQYCVFQVPPYTKIISYHGSLMDFWNTIIRRWKRAQVFKLLMVNMLQNATDALPYNLKFQDDHRHNKHSTGCSNFLHTRAVQEESFKRYCQQFFHRIQISTFVENFERWRVHGGRRGNERS